MHKLVLCKHRIPMIKSLAATFNTCFMQHLYIKLTIWNTRTQILKHKKSMDQTSKANCCNIYTAQISNMQNVELLKIIKYSHIGFYYVGLILNNTQFQNRFKNRFTIWEKNTFKIWKIQKKLSQFHPGSDNCRKDLLNCSAHPTRCLIFVAK